MFIDKALITCHTFSSLTPRTGSVPSGRPIRRPAFSSDEAESLSFHRRRAIVPYISSSPSTCSLSERSFLCVPMLRFDMFVSFRQPCKCLFVMLPFFDSTTRKNSVKIDAERVIIWDSPPCFSGLLDAEAFEVEFPRAVDSIALCNRCSVPQRPPFFWSVLAGGAGFVCSASGSMRCASERLHKA